MKWATRAPQVGAFADALRWWNTADWPRNSKMADPPTASESPTDCVVPTIRSATFLGSPLHAMAAISRNLCHAVVLLEL